MADLMTIERNINKMRSMGAGEDEINIYKQGALQQAQGGQMSLTPEAITNAAQAMNRQPQIPPGINGLEFQGMTLGKTPSLRFVKPKIEEKKSLTSEQNQAISGAMATISNLKALKDMKKNIKTGWLTPQGLPFGVNIARKQGKIPDIKFAQLLRLLQSNFITSQTGAQRGFPEIQWLSIALPTGDIADKAFNDIADSSIDNMKRNFYNMLLHAKRTGKEIGDYEKMLPPVFNSEEEALKSGIKGEMLISGRLANID